MGPKGQLTVRHLALLKKSKKIRFELKLLNLDQRSSFRICKHNFNKLIPRAILFVLISSKKSEQKVTKMEIWFNHTVEATKCDHRKRQRQTFGLCD